MNKIIAVTSGKKTDRFESLSSRQCAINSTRLDWDKKKATHNLHWTHLNYINILSGTLIAIWSLSRNGERFADSPRHGGWLPLSYALIGFDEQSKTGLLYVITWMQCTISWIWSQILVTSWIRIRADGWSRYFPSGLYMLYNIDSYIRGSENRWSVHSQGLFSGWTDWRLTL